jgi:membrane-bound lytic murein transglycosylase B
VVGWSAGEKQRRRPRLPLSRLLSRATALLSAGILNALLTDPAGAQNQPPVPPTLPPVTAPAPTAPVGADENLRAQTLAEVATAKAALTAALRAEGQTRQKAATLDRALGDLEGQRSALAGEERAAADKLETTRGRLRTAAISEYISGGATTIANQLLRSGSLEDFSRNRVYGSAVLSTQERLLSTYREALTKVTTATSGLGRQVDRVKADRSLVAQELEALTAQRVLREQELAQKQVLNQLVTAAAPVLPSDIPALVLDGYVRAAAAANRRTPGCRIHWTALAAVGRVESGHARAGGAALTLTGDTVPRILGPRLDGNGFAYVADTDGGVYDGDTELDRAVGPMQFIPGTWRGLGEDGNGDGNRDPNNIYDATTAAGMYLCRSRQGLDVEENLYNAALNYNHSSAYAALILTRAREYISLNMPGLPPGPPLPAVPFSPNPPP